MDPEECHALLLGTASGLISMAAVAETGVLDGRQNGRVEDEMERGYPAMPPPNRPDGGGPSTPKIFNF